MTWITTHSGRNVEPLNLNLIDIDINDIAHSLSHICRFNGHCQFPYSVAQHSLLVMDLVGQRAPELRLAALMHDATEAYICDLPKPIKNQMPEYSRIEQEIWERIAIKFGMPAELPPIIKEADLIALATEKRDIVTFTTEPWACLKDIPEAKGLIKYISPNVVKEQFLNSFYHLINLGIGKPVETL